VNKCPLLPTGTRVVIQASVPPLKTARGLLLLRSINDQPQGTVCAVGPDCTYLQAGQFVVYKKYVETIVTIDADPYSLVKEDDVLCVIA